MKNNYSFLKRVLGDVKILDIIMLVFLFSTMAFFIYLHFTTVHAGTITNQEKSK